MPWVSLANNQAVTFNNLWDAVNTGVFIQKQPIPTSNECITKADANDYVYINTSYASYAAKASNQLVVKQDLQAASPVNVIVYTPSSGVYPLSGSSIVATSGTITSYYSFDVYLYVGFNSAGLNSGTVNNDSMLIVPQPAKSISGATITSFGQVITSGLAQRYILTPSTTYNITLTKGDLLGGGSTVRFYYSLCDLCVQFPL
jgi:hypothetical protein